MEEESKNSVTKWVLLDTGSKESFLAKPTANDKNGKPTNEGNKRLKIWKEHFDAVLNKDPPERPIQPHEMERRQNDREFDIGPFRPTELKSAIKATKNRKAAGLDNAVAELLKTDLGENEGTNKTVEQGEGRGRSTKKLE